MKNNVKEFRLNKGWTITELAKRAELSAKTISKMEKGSATSEVSERKVANALHMSHKKVFSRDDKEN